MSSEKRPHVFASVSIVALFVSVAVLVIAWLFDPAFLGRTEKVVTFLAGVIPGTAIAGVVGRQLARRLRENRWNLSAAVTGWLADESLLLALLWVFVIVEFIAATFLVPIYSLRVEVVHRGLDALHIRVVGNPGEHPFALVEDRPDTAVYRSAKSSFRWGDSVVLVAAGPGLVSPPVPVTWSAFALLEVGSGYAIGRIDLAPPTFRVAIRVTPNDAAVTIRQDDHESVYTGPQTLYLPRGPVRVTVTAAGYITYDEHKDVESDAAWTVALQSQPGGLKVVVVDAVGAPLSGIDVYVDGVLRGDVGAVLSLPPGDHVVRADVCRNNGVRLLVHDFHVVVHTGATQTVTKVAESDHC